MPLAAGAEADVVRLFGIEPTRVAPVPAATINEHWWVDAGGRRFVLRRYRKERSAAAIDWEHRLLRHAAGLGWPVAVPIATGGGSTATEVEGSTFALFPFLEGEPAAVESLAHVRIKGRLLGRLHKDLASFDDGGQRDGFGRAWEIDVFVQAAGLGSFNELLSRFEREYPRLAHAVRREKYRNLRELARLGYGDLAVSPVHADYAQDNILFRGPELTGLLDFDLARLDAPAFDIAAALLGDCLELPSAVVLASAFIEGYARSRRMDEREARLIAPLVRSATLWLCVYWLLQWHEGGVAAVASIARTVERRFPAVEAMAGPLTEAARRTCE